MRIESVERHDKPFPTWSRRTNRDRSRTLRDYEKAPRVYVLVKGEGVFDQLFNRRDRPNTLYRNAVMTPALQALGLSSDDCTLHWSQYAGCTCPCSPGFLVKAKKGKYPVMPKANVYITVVGDDAVVKDRIQGPMDITDAARKVA